MTGATGIRAFSYITKSYLALVARTCRLHLGLDDGRSALLSGGLPSKEALEEALGSRPTVLPFWNAHSLLVITSYIAATSAIKRQLASFQAATDDTAGGRITTEIFSSLGVPCRRISFLDSVQRLQDIREALRDRPNIAIAADSHGPYGSISPGMARFVRACKGIVRPISIWCNQSVAIFREIGMLVPLPGATLVFAIGQAIDLRESGRPVAQIRQVLQSSLDDLHLRVSAAGPQWRSVREQAA